MTPSSEESDAELWRAAAAGDGAAFEIIFRRHCDSVHTLCARRTGSYDAADDLVAKVFLEAWRKRDGVRFVDSSVRPWLLVVASNVSRVHLRSQSRYEAMTRRLRTSGADDGTALLDARLEAITLAPLLARALSTLSPADQTLVALCDLGEYPQREAAAILGIPVGTVKSRLSRAHRKLRSHLGESMSEALGLGSTVEPLLEVE